MSLNIAVPPILRPGSPFMVVAEAPGRTEMERGEPLVGSAGRVFDKTLERAGIDRGTISVTNVVCRAPDGGFTSEAFQRTFFEKRKAQSGVTKTGKPRYKTVTAPAEELEAWQQKLYEDIATVRPRVLVAMGNYALRALTGIEPGRGKNSGITKWRGSVLTYINDASVPVVPVIHPSAILRAGWKWFFPTCHDFQTRVVPLAKGQRIGFQAPIAYTEVAKSVEDIKRFIDGILPNQHLWTVDLETAKGTKNIYCIGLGYYNGLVYDALCIPWNCPMPQWSAPVQGMIIEELRRLFTGNPNLIGQNISFDLHYLSTLDITAANVRADLKVWHAVLYPELPHNLAFLVSWYLPDQAFYKDELKVHDKAIRDWGQLFAYNLKDVVCQLRLARELERETRARGLLNDYTAMVLPTVEMQGRGLPFDGDIVKDFRRWVQAERKRVEAKVSDLTGGMNVRSNKQMCEYLYVRCGLPVQRSWKSKTPSADEDALNILRAKHPEREDLYLIAYLRGLLKAEGDYLAMRVQRKNGDDTETAA